MEFRNMITITLCTRQQKRSEERRVGNEAKLCFKDTYCSVKAVYTRPYIKKQRHYCANKGPSSQSYGFAPPSSLLPPHTLPLERVWRKGNPLTLLVGMQTSTVTMENSVEIP